MNILKVIQLALILMALVFTAQAQGQNDDYYWS
jgi:hypothetical protein